MRLNSIQYGRAFAAMAVCAFHLSIMMGVERYGGDSTFSAYTRRGNLGVDFFFVLSGFILCYAHLGANAQSQQKLSAYAFKRFSRVYPTYWLYTSIFCGLVLLGVGSNSSLPTTFEGWATTITLIRFSAESPPLAPAWTLFHEIAFYAAFGIFLSNRRAGTVLFLAWILVAAVEFHYPPENQRTPLLVYTSAHIYHFILGAASYWLYNAANGKSFAFHALAHAAFALLTLATQVDPKLANLQAALVFAWIIFACTTMESAFNPTNIRWLSGLGESSYTLYLLHLPLQGAALKLLMKTPLGTVASYRGLGFIAVFTFTIAASHATYLLIEKPLLRHIARVKAARS